MTLDDPNSERHIMLWGGTLLFIAAIVVFLFQLFGPNSKIIVSEKTTVITAPLADDGLPDYQAYWRDLGRDGVTHDNNAAALFWQAVWPGELEAADRPLLAKALGFEKEPDPGDALQRPYSREVRDAVMLWWVAVDGIDVATEGGQSITAQEHPNFHAFNQMAEEVIDAAMSRPWTSDQVPPLADYVAKNAKPLDLLVEASKRPKWWSPSPSLLGGTYPGGIAVMLPEIPLVRDVARWFQLRAMWHAGEGRPREAWEDLKASFRFARITGKGPTLVGQLVAIAIDGITLDSTVTLLHHGEIDAAVAREILADLLAMERPCDIVRSFDHSERICYADMAVLMARDNNNIGAIDFGSLPSSVGNLSGLALDWNHILREGNRWYDRLVEVASLPNRDDRRRAFAELDDDLSSLVTYSLVRKATAFLSKKGRTSLVSDVMISLMLPALEAAINAEDRAVATLDLVRVSAALAVYRAEQGHYPEQLEQLVPGVIAEVPDDLYSGKPFIYERKTDDGYLLYSLFENGLDDGGTDFSGEIVAGEWVEQEPEDFDYQKSDMVIRVPMLRFELPEIELPEGAEWVE